MKYLLTGVIALSLFTACGQNDKPSGEAALAAIEFDAEAMPDVRVRSGEAATAGQALSVLSLSSSGQGRVQFSNSDINGDRATFTGVTLSAPELAGEDSWDEAPTVTAERLEFDGLGVFDGQTNFGLMRLSNIRITPDAGAEDQTTGTISYIELINPSAETAAWVASVLGQGEAAEFPTGAALSFDRWAVGDINMMVADASGEGRFTLGSLHISDLGQEKAGRVGLSDLVFSFNEVEMGDVNIRLDGLGLAGINYALLVAAANSGDDPAAFNNALQADPSNPGFDAFSLKGFNADIVGAAIDLPSMVATVSRDGQARATRIKTDPFTMTLAARDNEDGEGFASALATLGYETLRISGAGDQQYDPDTDILTLPAGQNYIQLDDGFKLDFSAKYAGTRAIAAASAYSETDPDAAMDSLMTELSFHQLGLALKDDGFFNRALNAYAAQSGEDPAQVRAQMTGLLAMAPMFVSGMGIDAAVVTELAGALSSFVQEPKTLTITLAPPAPLTPQALIDATSDPSNKLTKASLGFAADNR